MERNPNEGGRSPREIQGVPNDHEAEAAVLGCVLLDNESLADVVQALKPEAFYRSGFRMIFEAMIALYDRNEPIDFVTLKAELTERGVLERVGGPEAIIRLAESVPTATNVLEYARIISDKAVLRRLMEAANTILADAQAGRLKTQELLEEAEKRIFEVAERGEGSSAHINEVLSSTLQAFEKIRGQGEVPGLPTGYFDLDRLTCGFQPGQFIVIAGRPSMGKTTFTLNCARNIAMHARRGVIVFSLEMAREQIASSMLCSHGRVDAQKLRKGDLSQDEWRELPLRASELAEAPVFIDDSAGLTPLTLKAKARRLKAKGLIDLVVVDYLQLMDAAGYESRQQEISSISRSMKALARELEIPVIAISQLSRAVDNREDHRPRMSDLRESGAIEQDADLILFLYREEYYEQTASNEGICEVICAKQRNGPTGTVKVAFLSRYLRFENLAYESSVH